MIQGISRKTEKSKSKTNQSKRSQGMEGRKNIK